MADSVTGGDWAILSLVSELMSLSSFGFPDSLQSVCTRDSIESVLYSVTLALGGEIHGLG